MNYSSFGHPFYNCYHTRYTLMLLCDKVCHEDYKTDFPSCLLSSAEAFGFTLQAMEHSYKDYGQNVMGSDLHSRKN